MLVHLLHMYIMWQCDAWLWLAGWCYFVFLGFLSGEHLGQNHLPLGLEVSPTHWKWNHSMGHCGEGGMMEREEREVW